METLLSTGLPRSPTRPPSPVNNGFLLNNITLPAPPPTRQSEITISHEFNFPDSCISCPSGCCTEHGQIHETFEPPELQITYEYDLFYEAPVPDEILDESLFYEAPVPDESLYDADDEADNSDMLSLSAPQTSFFDEEESESENPSDDDDETSEAGLVPSDSEGEEDDEDELEEYEEDELEPEIENVEAQLLAAYYRGPCGRLHQP